VKTISDGKLAYLVGKLLDRIGRGEDRLAAHLADTGNPHGVSLSQLTGGGGEALLNAVYPVGAIYMSARPESPAALFGGSWERLEDRFLLGAGEIGAGSRGGAAEHTLTAAQLPRHTHRLHIGGSGGLGEAFDRTRTALEFQCQNQYAQGFLDGSTLEAAGEGAGFSVMPPYLAVYMWQRTA